MYLERPSDGDKPRQKVVSGLDPAETFGKVRKM